MNAPVITPATIRGRAALDEVRSLFDQLYLIDSDIEAFETATPSNSYGPFNITHDEVRDVLKRRRDAVTLKLENKGLKIAPDPTTAPAPTLEVEQPV